MGMLLAVGRLLGLETEELLARFRKNAIAWSAIAFFLLVTVVFLLMGLNNWLTGLWGPIVAPLVIAGVALVIAAIIYGTITLLDNMARRRVVERRHSTERTAIVTSAALAALPVVLRSDLVRKVGVPVGGALAALYLISREGNDRGDHPRH